MNPYPKRRSRIVLPDNEYDKLKRKVRARDGHKCRVCKRRNNLTVHHVIYRSQLGDDASYNLVTVCLDCHVAIHSGDIELLPLAEGQPLDANKGLRIARKTVSTDVR